MIWRSLPCYSHKPPARAPNKMEQDKGVLIETGSQIRPLTGLIFIFNLIVGTGALTMPKAFSDAGWLLSSIIIMFLGMTSFITVTYVKETMSISNAVYLKTQPETEKEEPKIVNNEEEPLIDSKSSQRDIFDIKLRFELGQMARMYFRPWGVTLFYIVICLYLYGDLAIYAAAVPKSLRDVTCSYVGMAANISNASKKCIPPTDGDICWPGVEAVSRINAYRIYLVIFITLLGGCVFFDVQKTKILQIITSVMRWLAFSIMVGLAIKQLAEGRGQGHPPVARIAGVPTLFGVCVYSFMCHHSLPSLLTPIKNKSKLTTLLAADYLLIAGFYILLSMTGIFTFRNVSDLYTLNFKPDYCHSPDSGNITNIEFLKYFIALFPVFTLSTNFPIIGITLRNNLKSLFFKPGKNYHFCINRILIPLLAIIPPMCLALATDNVEILVGITGSYLGAGIQYVIPATLVLCARKHVSTLDMGHDDYPSHVHVSPFKHSIWAVTVLLWAVICVGFVTVNFAIHGFQ